MKRIHDLRQLEVGNIVLAVGYDEYNFASNDPGGWFHTVLTVTAVGRGHEDEGVLMFLFERRTALKLGRCIPTQVGESQNFGRMWAWQQVFG